MNRTGAPRETAFHETERLRLRPWRVEDAVFDRELWLERDPRVPAHRRVGADGSPTVADLEDRVRRYVPEPAPGLLVVELRGSGAPIGYCGLVANGAGRPDEPERAFEFLRSAWNRGSRPRRHARSSTSRAGRGTGTSRRPCATGTVDPCACWRSSGSPARAGWSATPTMATHCCCG